MDVNPYQPPTTCNESPSRTDISLIEGLAHGLGWVALRTAIFLIFAALAFGVVAIAAWLQ